MATVEEGYKPRVQGEPEGYKPKPLPKRERRGDLAPIIRDLDTGEWRFALPNLVLNLLDLPNTVADAVKLPGQVMRGEVNPMSEEGFERGMGLAMLIAPGAGLARGTMSRSATRGAARATAANRREFGMDFTTPKTERLAPSRLPPEPAGTGGVASSSTSVPAGELTLNETFTGRHAGNIRLDRIYGPEDVKAAISATAEQSTGFMQARRGVQTQDMTRELAQLTGMTAKKLSFRKAGKVYNAEELFAARNLLVEQATKVRDAAKLAETGTDLQKAGFQREMVRLRTIQEQVSGATAEAGRALQQFRMLAGASKDEVAALARIGEATGTDAASMARMVNQLDTPEAVASFVRNAGRAKTSDMVLEAWINGLLTNPTTHATNILSNALVNVWGLAEAAGAATISKVTGSGILYREVGSRAFGALESVGEGLRAAFRGFRTEEELFGTAKLDTRRMQSIPGTLGSVLRTPGRLLTAEDAFFKTLAYRQEINALAVRHATAERLRGRALADRISDLRSNPTEAMQEAARTFARKQTFTAPLGPIGSAGLNLLHKAPALRIVSPFFRTPVNLIKFAAERSPLAVFSKDLRGKSGAVARDQALSKMALGTAISGWSVYQALQGNITGDGPKDPAERALLYADGWQPNSVKVGGTYYSYGRLEPLGTLLGISAGMAEVGKHATDKELDELAGLIFMSVAKNLTSKTWLSGPAKLMEAISDPDRYGGHYIERLVGSIVPAGVAHLARVRDPFLREAQGILEGIQERLPGAKEQLMLKRDVFGEPIQLGGALGPDIASPIYESAARNDPTIAELLRLDVHPGRLDKKIEGAELTPQEWDFYSQASGQSMKQYLDALVSVPAWPKLPDDMKVEAMEDVIRKSRSVARTATKVKFPDLMLRIAQAKEKK